MLQSDGPVHRDPLTTRDALIVLESLYDLALNIEQVGREQPDDPDDFEAMGIWYVLYNLIVDVYGYPSFGILGRHS